MGCLHYLPPGSEAGLAVGLMMMTINEELVVLVLWFILFSIGLGAVEGPVGLTDASP